MLKVGVKGIAVAAGYAVLYVLLREASVSHWLLPAGLRFAALLFFPLPYWPAILLGDVAGSLYYRAGMEPTFGMPWLIMALIGPLVASVAPALALRLIGWGQDPTRLATTVAQLLSGALVASVLSAAFGIWALGLMRGQQNFADPMPHYFALFTVGDYLGILVVAPLALTAFPRVRRRMTIEHALHAVTPPGFAWAVFVGCAALFVLFTTARGSTNSDIQALARVGMFAPVVFMTYRHGWLGAVPMVFIGNIALQATMPHERSPELVAVQFLMALVGSAMLALGAIATEFQTRNRALAKESHKHLELARTNLRWGEMRSMQSAVLLEAAYTNYDDARASDRYSEAGRPSSEIAQARWNTGLTLRREVQRAVESLRLSALHNEGLRVALMVGPIATTLDAAGVRMPVRVTGDTRTLPSDMHVLIYRLTHEFVTRLARDCKASRVRVRLIVANDARRSVVLVVKAKRGDGPIPSVPPPFATSYEIKSIAETYHGIYHDRSSRNAPTFSLLLRDR